MRTALDAPDSALDEHERDFIKKLRTHGWFGTHVFGKGEYPNFTYTTGFWLNLEMPEVILFSLKQEVAHNILWSVFKDWRSGLRPPVGVAIPDLFGNSQAYLLPVATTSYPEHLGWSRWFYGGDDFPCLQLIWPDPKGVFPWQGGFDEQFRQAQPDLTEKGWVAALAQ